MLPQSWLSCPTHCNFQDYIVVGVFFFLLLCDRVLHSIPHPLRTYRLSVNAYQMKAGSPSLHWAKARIQSEQTSSGCKEEEKWEFALSVKSLWDNAVASLQKHRCEYNGGNWPVTASHLLSLWVISTSTREQTPISFTSFSFRDRL